MQSEQTVNLTTLIIIPLLLASQPDADWAEKLETPDQHTYYALFSRQFYWIARCWASRKAFQDDPLRPLLKAGRRLSCLG